MWFWNSSVWRGTQDDWNVCQERWINNRSYWHTVAHMYINIWTKSVLTTLFFYLFVQNWWLYTANVVCNCRYRKAVNVLENYHLQDGEEEAKQQHMLLKLYINLAVCYNKQKEPKKACVMCKQALYIEPRNAKAFFK